ncbi:hypothetical protein ACHAXT_011187 [Thalassiosira profunda]
MFQKDGSSTLGGKKDAALRKSDRRKLRDRAVETLFVGGSSDACDGVATESAEWIARAERLLDDAVVAPKGGEVLARKLRLPGGANATLFLRTPGSADASTSGAPTAANGAGDDLFNAYPTSWPYRKETQPILLEREDAERKGQLIPLLPLLAALSPPPSSPFLGSTATDATADDETEGRGYRIPNIAIHPEVTKYICRGADLMRSGVRSFPSPWALRQSKGLVTISVIGNPQPVAVGTVEHSLFREYCYSKNGKQGGDAWRGQTLALVGPGKKGVGVEIVNCYGDDLWKGGLPPKTQSGKGASEGVPNPLGGGVYDDGHFGNTGFVDGQYVHPILEGAAESDESDANEDNAEEGEGTVSAKVARLSLADDTDEQSTRMEEQPAGDGGNVAEEEAAPDHNDILERAFYTSLLLLLASKTPLPMPVSTYYAKHLLAAVPATGPRLDMKQTSNKKIGPFLLEMESNGVIKLGASKDKKDKCAFLQGIVKDHPDLRRFKREWKAAGGDALAAAGDSQKTKMAVVDLFIVPRHIADGLQLDRDAVLAVNAKTEERKGTGFLTKTECRALIEGYIETESLVDPKSKGRILINGPLCDALYKLPKKGKQPGQSAEYPTSVKRKDLIEKWTEKMDKGHAVVQMPGSKILHLARGAPKPVDIEVEFRQGNRRKFLTHIRGFEEYGIDGRALSQDVSHRFACSASVEPEPVGRPALKKGRVEIVFQGHLAEELTALLTGDATKSSHGGAKGAEYSLPKSVIDVKLRKGVPARKKR